MHELFPPIQIYIILGISVTLSSIIFHVIVMVMVILFIKQIISELNQKKSQRISVLNPEEKRPG